MQETVMEVVCVHRTDETLICFICGTQMKEGESPPRIVIGIVQEVVREKAKWPNE